jgi:hypothetical protein
MFLLEEKLKRDSSSDSIDNIHGNYLIGKIAPFI